MFSHQRALTTYPQVACSNTHKSRLNGRMVGDSKSSKIDSVKIFYKAEHFLHGIPEPSAKNM